MHLRRSASALALVGLSASAVAACGSSTTSGSPHGASTAGGSTSSTPTTATTSTSAAPSATASSTGSDARQQFAAALANGYRTIKTAQLRVTGGAAGQSLSVSGAEKLADGTVQAVRIAEDVGQIHVEVVKVGDEAYVELPKAERMGAPKPWFRVSTHSKYAIVRMLATTVGSSLTSSPLDYLSKLNTAATSVTNDGSSGGLTHYHVVVDPSKLGTGQSTAALQHLGLRSVPLDVYLDSQGRARKVTESFSIAGHTVHIEADVTSYNQPVTITAPPSSQINSG